MNFSLISFVSLMIFAFYYSSAQSYEEYRKKYCDPSLSDENIKELEKCETTAPEEVCIKPYILLLSYRKMNYSTN